MKKVPSILLPYWLKIPGVVLFLTGLVLGYIRFKAGIEPPFLDVKVFAIFSSYFENKYFQLIDNNIIEELAGICLILGLFLMAFGAEKSENNHTRYLRVKALYLSFYILVFFLICSLLFTYGMAFVYMMILSLALPFLSYILIFRLLLIRHRIAGTEEK